MPSLLKIKIERARDLPIMDKNLQGDASTDAYVVMSLDSQTQRTRTCRKSLNPAFNEEFRFEIVDDSILQNVPLELKVMDQDLYSSELIGVVYIDLTPLIMRTAHSNDKDLVIQGWFPLFDTTKGLRGFLSVVIKLQFIGNDNPFRDSSAGVQFFSSSSLSLKAFVIQEVLGLVVDLVVDDDLESSWQDYFRKANKSTNDSRLKVLYNLSAEVRREIGKKVLELGGNAVLGYLSHFDMIGGSSGLVVRAYGTACRLLKVGDNPSSLLLHQPSTSSSSYFNPLGNTDWSSVLGNGGAIAAAMIPTVDSSDSIFSQLSRTSGKSSSEQLFLLKAVTATSGKALPLIAFGPATEKRDLAVAGVTPLRNADWNGSSAGENGTVTSVYQSDVSLLSLKSFDIHVRIRLGGLVMSRSVKFLGKLEATLSDQETREGWWEELRDEIKNHARTVCCTHVIGYTETCTIFGDVCVLSAVGTAAVVKYLGYPTTLLNSPSDPRVSPLLCSQPPLGPTRRISKSSEKSIVGDESEEGGDEYDDDEEEEEELEPDEFGSGMKIRRRRGTDSQQSLRNLPRNIPKWPFQGNFLGSKSPSASEKSSSKSLQTGGFPDPPLSYATNRRERSLRLQRPCSYVHVPYNHSNAPFSFLRLVPCISCRRKWVPETILATIEPSPSLVTRGNGQLLEARVCRTRKAAVGETDAVKISELLPFVEFDVQKQLMLKLKVAGMNACFGYSCKIQIGSDMVIAMATCTAVFLEALPPSPTLHFLKAQQQGKNIIGEQDGRLIKMQKDLEIMYQTNKDAIEAAATAVSTTLEEVERTEDDEGCTGSKSDFDNQDEAEGQKKSKAKGNVPFTKTGTTLHTLTEEEDDVCESSESSSSSSSSSSEGDDDSSLESPPSSSSSSTSSSSSSSSSESDNDSPKEVRQSRRGSDMSVGSKEEERERADSKDTLHRRSVRFTADTVITDSTLQARAQQDDMISPDLHNSRKSLKDKDKEKKEKDREKEREERRREKVRAKDRERSEARRPTRARRKVYKDDRPPVVVEIDEETDVDMIAVLHDWSAPIGIEMVNIGFVPGARYQPVGEGRTVTVLLREKMSQAAKQYRLKTTESSRNGLLLPVLNLAGILTALFKDAYLKMCLSVRQLMPCHVLGLTHSVNILEEDTVEIMISAIAHRYCSIPRNVPVRQRRFQQKFKSLPFDVQNRTFGRISNSDLGLESSGSNMGTNNSEKNLLTNLHINTPPNKNKYRDENGIGSISLSSSEKRSVFSFSTLSPESKRNLRSKSFDSTSNSSENRKKKYPDDRQRSSSLSESSSSTATNKLLIKFPVLDGNSPPASTQFRVDEIPVSSSLDFESVSFPGSPYMTPRTNTQHLQTYASSSLSSSTILNSNSYSGLAPQLASASNSSSMTRQGDSAIPEVKIKPTAVNDTNQLQIQDQDLGSVVIESEDRHGHGQRETNVFPPFLASKLFPQSSQSNSSSNSPPERIANNKDNEICNQEVQVLQLRESQSDHLCTDQAENKTFEGNGQRTPNRSPSFPLASSLVGNRNQLNPKGAPHNTTQGTLHNYSTENQCDSNDSPNVFASVNQNSHSNASSILNHDRTYSTTYSNNGSFNNSFQTSPINSNLTRNIAENNEHVYPGSSPPLFATSQKNKVMRSPRKLMSPSLAAIETPILLTPLDNIPGGRIKQYLGPVQLHFIKDSWSVRGEGVMESFYYLYITEVNASARAQVAALGGNALMCHRVIPQESGGRSYRNQTYVMISVVGDAVLVEYDQLSSTVAGASGFIGEEEDEETQSSGYDYNSNE